MGSCCSKKKLWKIEYFKEVRKNMKLSYDSNFPNNIEYIIKKKKFDSKREYIENIENSDNLWKTYLLDKINEENLDFKIKSWKVELFEFIKETKFFNQYIFQNWIFFQEIFLLNKPKTKNKKVNDEIEFHFLDTEPIFSPLDIDELKSISKSGSTYSTKKIGDTTSYFGVNSKIKENETKEFTISLTMESVNENDNNPELIAKYNSYVLKKYLKIIREHLEQESHPLRQIIKKFIKLIETQIRIIIATIKENEDNHQKCYHFGLEIVNEIRNFIEVMQVTLKVFYSKSINFKYFKEEKDEIINLLSYIIFKDKTFYRQLKNLFSYMNTQKIKILEKKFKNSKDITPKEIGVHPKFCLDKTTDEFWEDYKKKKNINSSNSSEKSLDKKSTKEEMTILNRKKELKKCIEDSASEIFTEDNKQKLYVYRSWTYVNKGGEVDVNEDEDIDFDQSLGKIKRINVKEKLINDFEKTFLPKFPDIISSRESSTSLIQTDPYNMAFYYLSQIDNYQVPLEKLIIISFLSVIIMESVDKFWEGKNDDLPPEFLTLTADDIMTIYLYIIYKLGHTSIAVQLEFIKYFTTTITKQSVFGYYYSTFEGCIRYLELEEKDKDKNKDRDKDKDISTNSE